VVHVAAGVIAEGDRVFLTRRPPHAHQGGKWEFPGGKIHAGESVLDALRRELHEELGIDVESAHPFMQVHHRYPDKSVLLDVWRVTRYRGTPHGREGQEASWASTHDLLTLDFPDADLPIQRRLWLPGLYAISDAAGLGRSAFLRRLEQALAGGLRLLQLREPSLSDSEYLALARDAVQLCRPFGARLLLNADPALVEALGADGVHLSGRRLARTARRPLPMRYFVAASCHDAHELERARALGVDFAVLGPVAPTASHPGAPTLGWPRFESLCRTAPLAVYAIGGMQPRDMTVARSRGAAGLAMIRGLWDAADVAAVVRACEAPSA
jgi:8-oxo-dGTP diphosphatase